MKLSTINQIIQAIVDKANKETNPHYKDQLIRIANGTTIYLKTVLICEDGDIDSAIEYFWGTHTEDEYKDWLTSVTKGEENGNN